MKSLLLTLLAVACLSCAALAKDDLPAKPEHYFNDYAGLVSSETASKLDAKLTALDKETTTQFVVAVYPTYPSETDTADFAQRTLAYWGVGQKETNNGVVLFIFLKDDTKQGKTTTFLSVGYGLEGPLPDVTAKSIVDEQIRPHIRAAKNGGGQKEWDAAVTGGVNATIAAIHNEYKAGTTSTASHQWTAGEVILVIVIAIVILIIFCLIVGNTSSGSGGGYYGGSSDSGGSSWGGSSGGDSGFSGGGGDGGGGGAGGSD